MASLTTARGLLGFDTAAASGPWWTNRDVWIQAAGFAVPMMAILFAHEMGHFMTARRYGVKVSPPYFIPSIPPLGTFGAFIKMEMGRVPARALMRIAAFGPFAGMIVAVPVIIVGLLLSDVVVAPSDPAGALSECLLMRGIELAIFPNVPEGHTVLVHPMAFAGWAGCFLTAFNLVPISQLDGGHILYCLVGNRRFGRVAHVLWWCLVALTVFWSLQWLLLAVLLRNFLGIDHPPMLQGDVATGVDRAIGVAAMVLFVLTFVPEPFGDMVSGIELISQLLS